MGHYIVTFKNIVLIDAFKWLTRGPYFQQQFTRVLLEVIAFNDIHIGEFGKTDQQTSGREGPGRTVLIPDVFCCHLDTWLTHSLPGPKTLGSDTHLLLLCLWFPSLLPLIIGLEACVVFIFHYVILNMHKNRTEQNKEPASHYPSSAIANILSVLFYFSFFLFLRG